MRYLLDTNVVSGMVRVPRGAAAARFAQAQPGEVGTSIIAAAELRFGYTRVGSKRIEGLVEAILGGIDIAPWQSPADMAYARLRTLLERRGVGVGQNDMLIASHALALDAVLVTDDRAFSRVPGLKVENWLAGPAGH